MHGSDCLANLLCESKIARSGNPPRHMTICAPRYGLQMGDITKLLHLPTASRIISANCMIVYSSGFPWKKKNQKERKTQQLHFTAKSVNESQAFCRKLDRGKGNLSIAYWHDSQLNRFTLSLFAYPRRIQTCNSMHSSLGDFVPIILRANYWRESFIKLRKWDQSAQLVKNHVSRGFNLRPDQR